MITAKEKAVERVYSTLREELFQFSLLPGSRLSENEVAARIGVSRTPVREALTRLRNEKLVELQPHVGWQVSAFDFAVFEELYDVRIAFETAALRKICEPNFYPDLTSLQTVWTEKPIIPKNVEALCALDEQFHQGLIHAAGNQTMWKMHNDIDLRIHQIRRLDFFYNDRVDATYREHAEILDLINRNEFEKARELLVRHIGASKAQVRMITLHMLESAKKSICFNYATSH